MKNRITLLSVIFACAVILGAQTAPAAAPNSGGNILSLLLKPDNDKSKRKSDSDADDSVQCANLIYAGAKTSQCFSDKFLEIVGRETNIQTEKKFQAIKLSEKEVFEYPFALMTGEGNFTLLETERKNLREYLTRGGFLLASSSCSSDEWNRSFRAEIQKVFPEKKMETIKMDHPLFRTVFDIQALRLKSGGNGVLEGLEHNGKIVMIYSSEGLNDTPDVEGCCCCGGNEVSNSKEVNVNIFTYALTH